MEQADLANMATQWSVILRAAQEQGDAAAAARGALLLRYHEAVLRYLRAQLRDEHAAWQVYSNFAVRILQVDRFLQRADPGRGRFRDYLKTILRHMVSDYYREQHREHKHLEELARRSPPPRRPPTRWRSPSAPTRNPGRCSPSCRACHDSRFARITRCDVRYSQAG